MSIKRTSCNQPQFTALIISLSMLSILGWITLYRWYALFDHYTTPGFALDRVPGHFGSVQLQLTALIFIILSAIYSATYWLLKRMRTLSAIVKLTLVSLVGVMAIINIFLYPIGAIDLFSYLGQLKLVSIYHQNPYLVTCLATFATDPLTKLAPFLELPLVYGPTWVIIAGWPLRLVGFDDVLRMLIAYKVWSLLFLLLSGWCIYLYHDDEKSGWLGAYLFLANPLILFEALGNAHNDVMMTAFLISAALAVRRRSWVALPLMLIAALIKAFALILIPAFLIVIYHQRWSRASLVASILFSLIIACVAMLPFWAGGAVVEGMFRAVALQQQLFATASVVSLVSEYAQQRGLAQVLTAIHFGFAALFVFAALAVMRTIQEQQIERVLVYLLLLFYILVSSLYPWYLIPVIGLLALDSVPFGSLPRYSAQIVAPKAATISPSHFQKDDVPSSVVVKANQLGLSYVFAASALALISYLVNIWARFDAGLSLFQMRLCVAFCLTVPIIGFLCFGLLVAKSLPRSKSSPIRA